MLLACMGVMEVIAAHAQIQQTVPADVGAGLASGTIQAAAEPAFTIGNVARVFDNNSFTEAVVNNVDSLKITLQFTRPLPISKSALYLFNNGQWSLESADSLEDLASRSHSYLRLVHNRQITAFVMDSTRFPSITAKVLRLTIRNPQTHNIYVGEWTLFKVIVLTSLVIVPESPKLVPGTSVQLSTLMRDSTGRTYPYNLGLGIGWSSDNPSVVTVDEFGKIYGVALGTAVVRAGNALISGTTTVSVVSDFVATKDTPRIVKVALVMQDQIIDPVNGRKIHQVRGWSNPVSLANQLNSEFSEASDGVVQFQIVETHDDQVVFSRLDGQFMTVDTLTYFFSSNSRLYGRDTPGTMQHIAEVENRIQFDYNAMIDYYGLADKRNNGQVDEVWVYAYPFAAMYESRLVGPNGFWWNSPPLSHPGLQRLISVMGLNYERGIAEAMESFGHRMESALWKAFGRWDGNAQEQNYWELFTTIDKDRPGKAQVGNIHFPPNGMSDYDYGNRRYVATYADNWKRYPILLDQSRVINCTEWGCSHVGYLRWWYGHLPRYVGVTDSVLNNWWLYWLDFYAAKDAAMNYTAVQEKSRTGSRTPNEYSLMQNFPNPFNPETKISFTLPDAQYATLKVFDVLGREVRTLVAEWREAGAHEVVFNAADLPSGIYFYRLEAGPFSKSRKLLILR